MKGYEIFVIFIGTRVVLILSVPFTTSEYAGARSEFEPWHVTELYLSFLRICPSSFRVRFYKSTIHSLYRQLTDIYV